MDSLALWAERASHLDIVENEIWDDPEFPPLYKHGPECILDFVGAMRDCL